MAEGATGAPANGIVEIAGPERAPLADATNRTEQESRRETAEETGLRTHSQQALNALYTNIR